MALEIHAVEDPKELDYIHYRDEEIRRCFKRGDKIEDISETFELGEETILSIVRKGKVLRKLSCVTDLSPRVLEGLRAKIFNLRLCGWKVRRMAAKLRVRDADIQALIVEFNIPFGIRCEDCDEQVILPKPSCAKLCRKCFKERRYLANLKYMRNRYRKDPKYRKKIKETNLAYKRRRKQAKILG
ncbi:Uncharacterised protein [uncultured archaeon]|nr:Uncharacterised protein [uncultured archaeon]